jgi:hypothetical protein
MKGSGSWSMESLHASSGTPGVLALCWESGEILLDGLMLKQRMWVFFNPVQSDSTFFV